jgi:hypothetical protein
MSGIVLSDEVLDGLLARPDHAQIPCLQFLKMSPAHKPCNCRNKRRPAEARVDGEQARICVSQLSAERLAQLKNILGTDRVILYMNTPGFPKRAVI